MRHRKRENNGAHRTRLLIGALGAVASVLIFSGSAAFAYWGYISFSSTGSAAQAVADSIPKGATPGTPVTNGPSGDTVSFSFSQVSTTSGNLKITAYTITRYPVPSGSGSVVTAACSGSSTVSCQETGVPSGTWAYTDTPYISGTNWTGPESAQSPSVIVDTTTPAASAPGVSATTTYGSNPIWVNNETVTLTDSPTDVGGSGVASVAYYYCPSAASTCTSSTPWTSIKATSAGGTWSVPWSGLPTDGTYKVVAVATGNNTDVSNPSTATLVGIDTTGPTVAAPTVSAAVKFVNGVIYVNNENVTLTDTASNGGSGVSSVAYYYCSGSSGSCDGSNGTAIGSSSSGSYSVTWSTPLPADGPYRIGAVATDNVNNPTTSSSTAVTVDTTAPSVSTPSVNGIS